MPADFPPVNLRRGANDARCRRQDSRDATIAIRPLVPFLAAFVLLQAATVLADDEAEMSTPAGFSRPGQAMLTPPAVCGHLKVTGCATPP